ncbi:MULTISPECIES: hypothetical protein [Phyllobacteriaceae]|jgi:hypothetical protein|nr:MULTISPECIES: hypothetical protein [Mesorhizobium]MBN9235072.1 hypothetical protein [Mesorhizobium sp.]MDQ0330855.1 hypothetical protein [Mesorhizobium sp. YL-MeA3-2017]
MANDHKLALLENSISYFREAVRYAHREEHSADKWKFAIVNVVQAMELAFKEYLRLIHPAFVLESIDKPGKTVGINLALSRIKDPTIGNISISDVDHLKIRSAINLRNELVHYEFDHGIEATEAKFSEIFAFVIFFYREHLDLTPPDFIDEDDLQKILQRVKARAEMLQKARIYAKSNEGEVWLCPECNEDTFIVAEEQCCFCQRRELVSDCESCGQMVFACDVIETDSFLEWDYDEGRMTLIERYDLPATCCPECSSGITAKIEDFRRAQYYEDLAKESRR